MDFTHVPLKPPHVLLVVCVLHKSLPPPFHFGCTRVRPPFHEQPSSPSPPPPARVMERVPGQMWFRLPHAPYNHGAGRPLNVI